MKQQVYRSWVQIVILAVCFGGFLVISLAAFASSDSVLSKRDNAGIAIYASVAVGSVIGLWRTFRLGVAVDPEGLHLRSLGRGMSIPWSVIQSISCEAYDTRLGVPVYAPIVRVAPDAVKKAQEAIPMVAMGSYRKSVAESRIKVLAIQMAEVNGG